MAIYTFSTKETTDPEVQKLKSYCRKKHLNFSAMMIEAVRKLNKELENANTK